MNFPELAGIDEIKARMPVTYVLHKAGHAPQTAKGRDLLYLTPWRQDSNPSLACYPEEDDGIVDRWRDMARTEGGDILDLIGMIDPARETFSPRTGPHPLRCVPQRRLGGARAGTHDRIVRRRSCPCRDGNLGT